MVTQEDSLHFHASLNIVIRSRDNDSQLILLCYSRDMKQKQDFTVVS